MIIVYSSRLSFLCPFLPRQWMISNIVCWNSKLILHTLQWLKLLYILHKIFLNLSLVKFQFSVTCVGFLASHVLDFLSHFQFNAESVRQKHICSYKQQSKMLHQVYAVKHSTPQTRGCKDMQMLCLIALICRDLVIMK